MTSRNRDLRRRPATRCRPGLEGLESRRLLTGGDIDALIGASATREKYGVDGSGLAAALIDTGVDYTNPALGGGLGPGFKVVDGFDFSQDKPNPYPVNHHGTSTAGIVASSDPTYPGVAPGANIVALRVFADDDSGDFGLVAKALRYAIDNHDRAKISVVNISISDGGNYSYDFFSRDRSIGERIAKLVDELEALNIPVVTASGNSFNGVPGMGFTSILTDTVSVTATDKADAILPNAQRLGEADGFAAATDLAAPGTGIMAPSGDRRWMLVEGTSFAAPLVTGGILLLQQIHQKWHGTLPKVDDVVAWLKGGATTIQDTRTLTKVGRIDLAKSAALIPRPVDAPPPSERPVTQIFVDGRLQSTVPSTAESNPLHDFGANADPAVVFDVIQIWEGGQTTTITPPPIDDLGEHFTRIDIFNARPAGVQGQGESAEDRLGIDRPAQARAFRAKLGKGRGPRPSGFARRVRGR